MQNPQAERHELGREYVVDPDYLKIMEIRLRRGRFFTPQDNEHAPSVAVMDDTLARKYFGSDDPIGKRIRLTENGNGQRNRRNRRRRGPCESVGPRFRRTKSPGADLLPAMQMSDGFTVLVSYGTSAIVRYAGSAPSIIESIRDTSRKMNSEQVVYRGRPWTKLFPIRWPSRTSR